MSLDRNKIGETLAKQIEYENKPFRHVSVLDLINIGYEFKMGRAPDFSLFLEEVRHCGKEMEIDKFLMQLYHLGIDTTSGVYVEAVVHRPIQTNKPTYGYRFGGLERMDAEWVNGDFVSYEARMVSSNMQDMLKIVKSMSGTPSDKVAERFYRRKLNQTEHKKKKYGE